jgi:transcriptional regulator with XRE-family HTH domain
MSFGEELRKIRKDKNLSIRKVGELSGISHAYLSQIENGKRPKPKPEIINKLSKALNQDYVELMEMAGYLEGLSTEEKERFSVNEEWRGYLKELLTDPSYTEIIDGNKFVPAVVEKIKKVELKFELDEELTPLFLSELISTATWQQEWIMELVVSILGVARSYVDKDVKELTKFLSMPNISFKGMLISDDDRERILGMLDYLFPEK